MMVQLADGFQGVLELAVVVEPTLDERHLLVAQAELTGTAARIGNGEHGLGMALAAGTLPTAGRMKGGALKQGAAQDLAGAGELLEETPSSLDDLSLCHLYR
jgi:hypothetical protein